MATGGYATTIINRPSDSLILDPLLRGPSVSGSSSTPSPGASGPHRKRRRTNNDKSEKEEEKATLKGGSFQLLEKVMTQLARSRRNVLQQAIDLLEEEYSGKLSNEHMDTALDFLENEAKSSMFSGIKDVARRDPWLALPFKWYRTDRYGARTNLINSM
ncbi:hypothetical protein V1525DRAFT_414347 [Lipomyces kononenkoae]|uniref:Uncharacterized protein n=1 Tax=Lipomyces kononenkoae TaxID=34357 RepID=A0ACC3SQW0_LIPKO